MTQLNKAFRNYKFAVIAAFGSTLLSCKKEPEIVDPRLPDKEVVNSDMTLIEANVDQIRGTWTLTKLTDGTIRNAISYEGASAQANAQNKIGLNVTRPILASSNYRDAENYDFNIQNMDPSSYKSNGVTATFNALPGKKLEQTVTLSPENAVKNMYIKQTINTPNQTIFSYTSINATTVKLYSQQASILVSGIADDVSTAAKFVEAYKSVAADREKPKVLLDIQSINGEKLIPGNYPPN